MESEISGWFAHLLCFLMNSLILKVSRMLLSY
eukprot:UN15439